MTMENISQIAAMACGTSSKRKLELAHYLLVLADAEINESINIDERITKDASSIKTDIGIVMAKIRGTNESYYKG